MNFGFDRFSGVYLWLVFIATFGLWKPELFLTTGTMRSVASQQAIIALMALAVLVPLAAGTYDLSVGATANLAGVIVVNLQSSHGWNMWAAIGAAIAASLVVGAVNGFFVARIGVSSFIATLGTASIVRAVQSIVSGDNQPTPPFSTAWNKLTLFSIGGFQIVFFYVIIVGMIVWWFLERTPAGRQVRAVGANPEAAKLTGVRVGRITAGSLMTAAAISGIAGIMYASQSGAALTFGAGLLLPAYAAAFLGFTQLSPGRFNVWGTLLAVYVLATGVKGLQLVTSVQWLPNLFNGVALIFAVGLAVWRQRRTTEGRMSRQPVVPDDDQSKPAISLDHSSVNAPRIDSPATGHVTNSITT
jgi:ribose transport system permease protein